MRRTVMKKRANTQKQSKERTQDQQEPVAIEMPPWAMRMLLNRGTVLMIVFVLMLIYAFKT